MKIKKREKRNLDDELASDEPDNKVRKLEREKNTGESLDGFICIKL